MKTTHQNLLLSILGALLVGTSACNAPGDDSLQIDLTDAGLRCPSSAGALDDTAQPLLGHLGVTHQPAAPASETFQCSCAERSVTYDTSPIELHADYRRCKTKNDACPVSERVVGRLATALTAEGLHIDEAAHTRQTDVCSPGAGPEELPHCTTNVTKTGYVEVAGNTSADFAGVVASCMRAGGIQAWNDAFDVSPDGPDWHAEPWGAASYCILFSMYRLAGYAAPDTDSDGVCNREDNCVADVNGDQADDDEDGVGDVCDTPAPVDSDEDGILDPVDNCTYFANANQLDIDDDGLGDACDADADNDGEPNDLDCAPLEAGRHKGSSEACDGFDNDCDEIADNAPACPAPRPGPAQVLQPIAPTAPNDFFDSIDELIGTTQTGVEPGALEARRVAVLFGRALHHRGGPHVGVQVEAITQSGTGETLTRADGQWDLVVNGGGPVTLRFTAEGYLPAERTVEITPWQDWAEVPPVALIEPGTAVPVDLDVGGMFSGWPATVDERGSRAPRIYIQPGTVATVDNEPVEVTAIRVSEYTVGPNGPIRMPATLPRTSAYTYAMELEALDADGLVLDRVNFAPPIVYYVDNFLDLKPGLYMPSGFYDPALHVWVARPDGRVIDVSRDENGEPVVATAHPEDGSDVLSVLPPESAKLANLIPPGAAHISLWRAEMAHFSTCDLNTGLGPPLGANNPIKQDPDPIMCDGGALPGSIIHCESRVLEERIPVAGSPHELVYRSDHAVGWQEPRELRVRILPKDRSRVHEKVVAILTEVKVAGHVYRGIFSKLQASDFVSIPWDGRDRAGRPLSHPVQATVNVGYLYPLVRRYGGAGRIISTFGARGGFMPPAPGVEAEIPADGMWSFGFREFRDYGVDDTPPLGLWIFSNVIWSSQSKTVGAPDARHFGLGGWSLSVLHAFDRQLGRIVRGDGPIERYRAREEWVELRQVADEDGYRRYAPIRMAYGVAVGPDGTVYVSEGTRVESELVPPPEPNSPRPTGLSRIFARRPDGVTEEVSFEKLAEDPADEIHLSYAMGLAVGPDGTLFVADHLGRQILARAPGGTIRRVFPAAPDASQPGDCHLLAPGHLSFPVGLAVSADGDLYFSESPTPISAAAGLGEGCHAVRVLRTDGTVSPVLGDGERPLQFEFDYINADNPYPDGGSIGINQPMGLALDANGVLYVAVAGDRQVIAVDVSGQARIHAGISRLVGDQGNGEDGPVVAPDGDTASMIPILQPYGLAVGPTGDLYVTAGAIAIARNALDHASDVYFGDKTKGRAIYRITSEGRIYGVRELRGLRDHNYVPAECVDFATHGWASREACIDRRIGQPSAPTGISVGPDGMVYYASEGGPLNRFSDGRAALSGSSIKVPSADGSELYEFDGRGRHLKTFDASTGGLVRTFSYAPDGLSDRPIAIAEAAGGGLLISQSGAGAVALTTLGGTTTRLTVTDGTLTQVAVGPVGDPVTTHGLEYAADDMLLTGYTDPLGHHHTFDYDDSGRLVSDALDGMNPPVVTRLTAIEERDPANNQTVLRSTATTPAGREQIVEVRDAPALGDLPEGTERTEIPALEPEELAATRATVSTVRTNDERVHSRVVGPNGVATETTVTLEGKSGTLQPVASHTATTVVRSTGVTTLEDAQGTREVYGGAQHPTAVQWSGACDAPDVAACCVHHPAWNSECVEPVPQAESVTEWVLDGDELVGYRSTATDYAGRERVSTRDLAGRVTESGPLGLSDDGTPFHRASFNYDSEGRLESASVGARTMTYNYHAPGEADLGHREPSEVVDAVGRTTRYIYDAARRLVSTTLPDETQITMDLDPAGNATRLRFETGPDEDSELVEHVQHYTPMGLEDEYTPPAPEIGEPGDWSTNREYDADRLLTSLRHPGIAGDRPLAIARTPATGRPTEISFDGEAIGVAYDATGRQTQLTAGIETLTYGYDGPLLVRETWAGTVAATLHTAFDAKLRPYARAITASASPPSPPPGSPWTQWLYDPTTRDVTGVVSSTGATLSITDRNALGGARATRVGAVATTAHIDPYAELSDLSATVDGEPNDATLFSQAFGRDALGRITALDETIVEPTTGEPQSRALTYEYHPLTGRISLVSDGATSEAYDYDLNGNRMLPGGEASYDLQDRMARFGEWHYDHNPMGQRTSKHHLDANGLAVDETTYAYDARGSLTEVVLPGGTVLTYTHDPLGRRVAVSRDEVVEHRLVYGDGLHPIAEVDADGDVVAEYVFFTRSHSPDLLVRDGVVYRYVADHLGSVRLLVRADTGAVVFRQDYDTWGRVTSSWTAPGIEIWQPFGFAGGIHDADTGLVRFGARDYDPEVGRWTAKDPIRWEGGQTNLFVYVADDPVNLTDPAGLQGPSMGLGVGIAQGLGEAIAGAANAVSRAIAGAAGALGVVGSGLILPGDNPVSPPPKEATPPPIPPSPGPISPPGPWADPIPAPGPIPVPICQEADDAVPFPTPEDNDNCTWHLVRCLDSRLASRRDRCVACFDQCRGAGVGAWPLRLPGRGGTCNYGRYK